MENTRSASSTIALAKRVIAIEESGSATGVYCDKPASLEVPAETNRLISADVEHAIGNGSQPEHFLRFGRWRLRKDVWVLEIETTKI